MFRRGIVFLLALMLSVSSCAEVRYKLTRGYYYTEDGKICRERDGRVFDSIWDVGLLEDINFGGWIHGDEHAMKEQMIEYVTGVDYDVEPFDDMLPVGVSSVAEDGTLTWARYQLPEGWHYMDEENDDLRVVSPTGEVYDSIWAQECEDVLWEIDKRYGHEITMRPLLISDENTVRYILPDGWYYMDEENDDLRVVSPTGKVYDNIWVQECILELVTYDGRYGEEREMRDLRITDKDAYVFEKPKIRNRLWLAMGTGGVIAAASLAVAVFLLNRRKKHKK